MHHAVHAPPCASAQLPRPVCRRPLVAGWEGPFLEQIREIRRQEASHIRRMVRGSRHQPGLHPRLATAAAACRCKHAACRSWRQLHLVCVRPHALPARLFSLVLTVVAAWLPLPTSAGPHPSIQHGPLLHHHSPGGHLPVGQGCSWGVGKTRLGVALLAAAPLCTGALPVPTPLNPPAPTPLHFSPPWRPSAWRARRPPTS